MSLVDNTLEASIEIAKLLNRSTLRLFRMLQTSLPEKGLSLSRIGVLGFLYRRGMATPTALAAYLHIQPQSLTRLVADLEQRKLITRQPNSADRRQSLLTITAAGVQLLSETVHDQQIKLAQIMAKELTSSERELLRIAAGLVDHLVIVTEAQTEYPGKPGPTRPPSDTSGQAISKDIL